MEKTTERFETLFAPLFPKDARFRSLPTTDGLRFSVNWKLKNDPSRPNKRSRRVVLMISQEAVEDHEDGTPNDRNTIERRMVDLVTAQLKQFNPDHDTPYGQPEPEEQWVL